ncbi:MAG: 30S ribosome-binding factor RbfA [Anaerolineales bacterium]
MVSKIRLERISDRIKEELSELLIKEISDPRLEGVSITDVRVDRELAYADIYVSAVEGKVRSEEILAGLEHAQGFIRYTLSQQIELRIFPRLRFHWDPTPEKAEAIEKIIASLKSQSQEREGIES